MLRDQSEFQKFPDRLLCKVVTVLIESQTKQVFLASFTSSALVKFV